TDVVPPSPLNPDGADVTLDGLAQEKLDAARRAVEELGHAVLAQALREATGGTGDSQRGDNVIPLRRAAGGR
ncbi:hypothetical protein, partial [Kineosporia sp. A_224]|uniref:hypothetical protein n=1 Tax=Kineosporia sp. A_224 TaxID=1962180 RepID=UPI001E5CAD02